MSNQVARPDGRYLAAIARGGQNQELMLFDFKTEKWEELANINPAFPIWSRDGLYVHFHSYGTEGVSSAFVDYAHAATAQHLDDAGMRDGPADHAEECCGGKRR